MEHSEHGTVFPNLTQHVNTWRDSAHILNVIMLPIMPVQVKYTDLSKQKRQLIRYTMQTC